MKVENLTSNRSGREVANQFEITDDAGNEFFQSYRSIIAKRPLDRQKPIELDVKYWNYSVTTSKYRNQWLGMKTKEIEAAIKAGTIILTNLNKK